jgi:predicted HicB family RNase H-like nuclease
MSYKGSTWINKKEWKRFSLKMELTEYEKIEKAAKKQGISVHAYCIEVLRVAVNG